MKKAIEVLDYIEENEVKWMENCEKMKSGIFKGLEELANYRLTQDASVDIVSLISDAPTEITPDWSLRQCIPPLSHPYLRRSQSNFIKALHTITQISKLKIGLSQILDPE